MAIDLILISGLVYNIQIITLSVVRISYFLLSFSLGKLWSNKILIVNSSLSLEKEI